MTLYKKCETWLTKSNPFYKPTHCDFIVDDWGIHHIEKINKVKYKSKIRKNTMKFWDLVFFLKDYEGVRDMTYDKFLEAYTAYEMMANDSGGDS